MVMMAAHSAMAKMLGLVVVGLALSGCSLLRLLAQAAGGDTGGPYSVPLLLVFGDSYSDVGNNNYLATSARADSPPYGIDSATGLPTGRFSNDQNLADYIARAIGSPEPLLAYLDPRLTGQRLLNGAVFASAGAGILNDTGIQQGNIIRISEQLQSFEQYKRKLRAVAGGKEQAERLINSALFVITAGTADFLNYLLPLFSARATQYNIYDFTDLLISVYRSYMRSFYELGARRVLIIGVGPLGCLPAVLAARRGKYDRDDLCDPEVQSAGVRFNDDLIKMGQQLNTEYAGEVVFIVANINRIASDFYSNAAVYGFTETRVACCGQGHYNGEGQCTPASNLCPNRDVYVNWDSIHLTDKANSIIVEYIVNGSPEVISPMNLNSMLNMDGGAF